MNYFTFAGSRTSSSDGMSELVFPGEVYFGTFLPLSSNSGAMLRKAVLLR